MPSHKIIIAGSGLTGLTLALLLAKKGVKVLLLDEKKEPGKGSKAICFSRRTLEIFDKLGVVKSIFEKGVQWNTGRIFFRNQEVHRFDLLPDKYARYPAFVNISQHEVENILIEAVKQEANIELCWQHQINALEANPEANSIKTITPEGQKIFKSKYLVACDGSRSTIRCLMNLNMRGSRSEEKFLIIDFKMEADFPSERWFWFAPPHNEQETILLHKQPDNIWRLDVKLGKEVPDDVLNDHAFVIQKIKQVVGNKPVSLEWVSLYRFSNKMLDNFIHGRVIFAGDAAHVFSPFGARGANSGIHDADNLAWKLAEILNKKANADFLQTYNHERIMACMQNITCTINSTLFISPPSAQALLIRDSILLESINNPVARQQINCGRLSTPNVYPEYEMSEVGEWKNTETSPGHCIKDCLMADGYLIQKLDSKFTLLAVDNTISIKTQEYLLSHDIHLLSIKGADNEALITLYELTPGSVYLIRPDQYILGRWKSFQPDTAIHLKKVYLSGATQGIIPPKPSAQELIDEEIAKRLMGVSLS